MGDGRLTTTEHVIEAELAALQHYQPHVSIVITDLVDPKRRRQMIKVERR